MKKVRFPFFYDRILLISEYMEKNELKNVKDWWRGEGYLHILDNTYRGSYGTVYPIWLYVFVLDNGELRLQEVNLDKSDEIERVKSLTNIIGGFISFPDTFVLKHVGRDKPDKMWVYIPFELFDWLKLKSYLNMLYGIRFVGEDVRIRTIFINEVEEDYEKVGRPLFNLILFNWKSPLTYLEVPLFKYTYLSLDGCHDINDLGIFSRYVWWESYGYRLIAVETDKKRKIWSILLRSTTNYRAKLLFNNIVKPETSSFIEDVIRTMEEKKAYHLQYDDIDIYLLNDDIEPIFQYYRSSF